MALRSGKQHARAQTYFRLVRASHLILLLTIYANGSQGDTLLLRNMPQDKVQTFRLSGVLFHAHNGAGTVFQYLPNQLHAVPNSTIFYYFE